MVQRSTYLFLSLKALEEDGICFHLGIGNLNGHRIVCLQIDCAKNRSGTATSGHAFNLIVVGLVAGLDRSSHWLIDSLRVLDAVVDNTGMTSLAAKASCC